jgi:moderate conductance mechanosensitive channel
MFTMDWLIEHGPKIGVILALAVGLTAIAKIAVRRVRRRLEGRPDRTQALALQRVATITQALSSVAHVVIWTVAVLLVLGEMDINIGPLIAGAGIAGVAIGFGAQSLVRDFLSGFFILLENQFGVGNFIEVRTGTGTLAGTVESLSMRVTAVRAYDGTLYVIPNGNIEVIGNGSRGWARAIVDVAVSRSEDLDRVRHVLDQVAEELHADPTLEGSLLSRPSVLGVEDMRSDAAVFRVVAETRSSRRWDVQRELRRWIQQRLEENGIEGPAGLASVLASQDGGG